MMPSRLIFSRMLVVLSALGLLAGCATPVTQRVTIDPAARAREEQIQQTLAIQEGVKLTERLWSVGFGILKGAAPECGEKVRPSLGFAWLSSSRVKPEMRAAATRALDLGPLPKVTAIYKGGAAEAAGLRVGDIVIDPRNRSLTPEDESREAAWSRLSGSVEVTVQRDGSPAPVTLTMTADPICDYPLKMAANMAEVNAFADGKQIVVSKGMMRFATEDRELALVIGHELGHNIMGHTEKKKTNALFGAIFDVAAAAYGVNTQGAFSKTGASAYSQDFEAEADYVGLYYLARAGYETTGAANFWRRMATEHPGNIRANHAASHPTTPERFLALEHTSDEIHSKQTSGLELVPNRTK